MFAILWWNVSSLLKYSITQIITVLKEVAKVMFLQVSVCPQGGWYPSVSCRWYRSMPCSRSPGGVCYPSFHCRWHPSMHCNRSPGGVLVWGGLLPGEGSAPVGGVCCWGGSAAKGVGVETPRKQTATVADGTHPTGMHSCLKFEYNSRGSLNWSESESKNNFFLWSLSLPNVSTPYHSL